MSAAVNQVDMPVCYTDAVLGVTAWPLTTVAWGVLPPDPGPSGATLALSITLQPGGLLAGGTAAGDAATATAADIASRFAAIWYQVMQPDMQLSLATSLNQPAGGAPLALPVAITPLRAHASACYAFSNAVVAALGVALVDPAAAPTLADVISHYGVDWQALGLAAGERPLGTLVQLPPAGLLIPSYAVFVAGGTVADLVPGGRDAATILADPDNTALPLHVGTELVVTPASQTPPADGLPLAALAAALHLTPASLVRANSARPALLAPGFVFVAEGVEVEVPAEGEPGADASLDDIAQTFADNGVPFDAVMAAVANADRPGMFRPGITLVVDRRLIEAGWTLASNATGIATATLATLNIATIDLFPAGSPLLLAAVPTTGLQDAPLGALARAYAVEPGDLLRHNAGLAPAPLAAGNSAIGLPVPGMSSLIAQTQVPRIPYRVRAGQTMTDIAALFAPVDPGLGLTDEQALCEANRAMPATLAPGQVITVAGQPLTTQAGDSFDALIARADPPVTITDLADAIATDTQALAGGALLLCPLALLQVATTPDALATRYGLSATAILSANAATPGLMVPGTVLKPSPVADEPTVAVAPDDTLNALIRRFAAAGIAVTVEDVVRANHDVAFLQAGALLLLPPAGTVLTAPFGTSGWQFPDVIFPLRTWVTLARNPALVDPALRGTPEVPGAAVQDSSPVAAARSATPERQEDGAVTLDVFAAAIEGTITGLKLATGRVLSAERDPAPTDVWAVSFVSPGGITQVQVAPQASVPGVDGLQPLSFALRPLSNTLESDTGVQIKALDPATGGWGSSTYNDYQGIDLEVWARAWLAGLDLLCTAPYAAPAYPVAPGPLARLLAAKKLLACAVADGLSPILVVQEQSGGTIGTDAWKAAREVLYQRLLGQLVRAYDTTAILQFNATVTSPPAAATARLSGAGRLATLQAPALAARQTAGDDPDAWKVSQLGNAKTALGNTTSGTVSFPLDVAQPARHSAVALQPVYAINEIEFGITPVVAGYDASNWLSFVRVFDQHPPAAFSAPLGTPVVPVPLRAYPELPALVSQQAIPPQDPTTLDEALHWSYAFTYTHDSAAQDQILIEIEFNRRPPVSARFALEDGDTLFKALAQYAAVSDTLWQILARLQAPGVSSADTVLATALDTYAGLAERVAALWAAWWGVGSCDAEVAALGRVRPAHQGLVHPSRSAAGQRALREAASARAAGDTRAKGDASPDADAAPPSSGAPHEFYHYLATLGTATASVEGIDVPVYATLTLQRLDADGDAAWPEITVIRADGVEVPLTGAAPVDATRVYSFPSGEGAPVVPAFTRLAYRWTSPGLHIARYQNANAAVAVVRNAQLLGAGGPQTCSAFVYRTPQMGFPEPLVPLITIDTRLDIGTWTDDAATNPLTPLFNTLFDGDEQGREIMVGIRYGYTLVPSTPPIETLLPVLLHPRFEYDPASTVQSIIDAVNDWAAQAQPVTTGGLWGFVISLYSSTDPALDRPLAELQRIVSPIG